MVRRASTPTWVEAGWTVSVNTVADSMRRQGLQGRKPKRRRGLTRQDRSAPKFPDLLHRDFTAAAPNVKWCGDITEIPTAWIPGVVATP
jgi:transposase InsO family protein